VPVLEPVQVQARVQALAPVLEQELDGAQAQEVQDGASEQQPSAATQQPPFLR